MIMNKQIKRAVLIKKIAIGANLVVVGWWCKKSNSAKVVCSQVIERKVRTAGCPHKIASPPSAMLGCWLAEVEGLLR